MGREQELTSRGRLLVPSLALLTTITSLVSSLGAPLVPSIAATEGVSISTAQWTLTATLLAGAVATPIVGRLGGNRHRRTAILAGLALVTFGLLISALPLGFAALVAGRAMQGVGIALTPLALAVAREFAAPARLSATIAFLSVTTVAGAGLGYPVTAFVASALGLKAAFWLGFVISALTLALAAYAVPPSRSSAADTVDWLGALMLAAGTSALLLGVSQGDPWGWGSPRVVGLFVSAALLLIAWAARTWRSATPLVDLRLATRPGTLAPNVTAVTAGVAVYMLLSLVMLQAQDPDFGLGASVTTAGLLLVPYSLFSVSGSRLALWLARRVRLDLVLPVGCALYMVATLALAQWHEAVWQLAVAMALAGVGSGLTFAVLPGLIVRGVPAEETGSATAFNHVLRVLGFSAGSALALALLEVFSGGAAPTDRGFTATILVASGILLATAALTGWLGLRRRVAP